jgi:hypothetical protein
MKKVAFGIESLEERIAPWPLGLDALFADAHNGGHDANDATNGSQSNGNGSTGTNSNGSNSDHS